MKYQLAIILLLIFMDLNAQNPYPLPSADFHYVSDSNKTYYRKFEKPYTLFLKVKFVPLPIGNSLLLITSIGGNVRFFKNHSLGLVYYHTYYGHNEENITDTSGVMNYSVNTDFEYRKNTTGSYRYYLDGKRFKTLDFDDDIIPYLGVFYRYGEIIKTEDPLFHAYTSHSKEKNFSKGVLVGMFAKINDYFGYDLNIGVYQRNSSIMHSTTHYSKTSYTSENKTSWGIRFDFGITLML